MFRIFRSALLAPCLIIFGIFFVYNGHKDAALIKALQDHGKTAKAEITKLEWKEKKSSNADSGYTAFVSFTTEDGNEIRERTSISAELGRALRNQSVAPVMDIQYLPESPRSFREVGREDTSDAKGSVGGWMLLIGFVILALRFYFGPKESEV